MKPSPLKILYEDNHLLAVVKPAGLPTMGASCGRMTLLSLAKQYVKQRYRKPGNVYLGVVSRLDAPASGVVILARTSKAARRLTEQFRSRAVRKVYWALVEGKVLPASGALVHWIARPVSACGAKQRQMEVVDPATPGAKEARLTYRRLAVLPSGSLLELVPETGRRHQIRLQLGHWGHAILGDRVYGSHRAFPAGIALHARRLEVSHPIRKERVILEVPVPAVWKAFGVVG